MKSRRILIVDDDEVYLGLVERVVEQAGIQARYATSGEEAVGLMKESRYETLITDLNMKGMDGYHLALVARELSPDIEVVMITGDVSPEVFRSAAGAGISTILAKPITSDLILELVRDRPAHSGARISW